MGATIEKVHQARATIASNTTSISVSLPSTFTPGRTMVFVANGNSTGAEWVTGDLASDGNSVTVQRGSASANAVSYGLTVVQLGGVVTVNKQTVAHSDSGTSEDVTLTTSVANAAKAFVIQTFRATVNSHDRLWHAVGLQSVSTIRFTRVQNSPIGQTSILYIVEF